MRPHFLLTLALFAILAGCSGGQTTTATSSLPAAEAPVQGTMAQPPAQVPEQSAGSSRRPALATASPTATPTPTANPSPTATPAPTATPIISRLFVSSASSNQISVINAKTGAPVTVISDATLSKPAGLFVSLGKLYVANTLSNTISIFDATTFKRLGVIAGGGMNGPYGIALTGGNDARIYVVNIYGGGSISIFNESDGSPVTHFSVSNAPEGIATFSSIPSSEFYVSGYRTNTTVWDRRTLTQIGTIPQHHIDDHEGIAYGYGHIYVSNFNASTVDVYDQSSGAYLQSLTIAPGPPVGVTTGGGTVFVAADPRGYIEKFSALDGSYVGNIYCNVPNPTYIAYFSNV